MIGRKGFAGLADMGGHVNPVRRLKIYLLGSRDYPEAIITVPEHLVGDLPDLVARARALNPSTSVDSVVQTIWHLGSCRLDQNLRHHIPVKVSAFRSPSRADPRGQPKTR